MHERVGESEVDASEGMRKWARREVEGMHEGLGARARSMRGNEGVRTGEVKGMHEGVGESEVHARD